LQVLQDRPIAVDVIDLGSGVAARSAFAAVTLITLCRIASGT
jgi:hypothetical protein